MRFDPHKVWPHPVLRRTLNNDDYPQAEFQVEIVIERSPNSTQATITVTFDLSEPDLLDLVASGSAEYVVLVKSTQTQFRGAERTSDSTLTRTYTAGDIAGQTEFRPFLIATRDIAQFRAKGWHADYGERAFDIQAGTVLAEDSPSIYWIDPADELPVGVIIGISSSDTMQEGLWGYDLAGPTIQILLAPADHSQLVVARSRMDGTPEAQNIMNGLYLPALIAVLVEVDREPDGHEDKRWFASLQQRLDAVGATELGSNSADRSLDAQKLLELPFRRLPIIAGTERGG